MFQPVILGQDKPSFALHSCAYKIMWFQELWSEKEPWSLLSPTLEEPEAQTSKWPVVDF